MKAFFACLLLTCLNTTSVSAQDAPTPLSPQQIAAQIKTLHQKTLILVFDVTQSTRHGGVFAEERAASATLLREGCSPGDRVVLLKFGTGYSTVFDKTLTSATDAASLIDLLPPATEPGHGTNIRGPHHEALKLIARDALCPAVVVLLTDSFNDRPDLTDPNYPKYLAYYTLKGLTVYPNSDENRDYERLLRDLKRKGCLHEFGVGVTIAPDGRPIERLPVGPSQGDSSTDVTTDKPTILAPTSTEKPHSPLPLILGAVLAALLLLLALWYLLSNRPIPLRLKLGDKGLPRDYRLRPGAKIALGGAPGTTAGSEDLFPLAGLAAPVAFIQAMRGGLTLTPAISDIPAKLFHNGLSLQQTAPLHVGDELRVTTPATDTEPGREHRIRIEDPRGPVF